MKHKISDLKAEYRGPSPKKLKLNNTRSNFVECPICNSSVYKSLINIHIDIGCTKKSLQKKSKASSYCSSTVRKATTNKSKQNKSSLQKWIQCPSCNKTMLCSQINFHLDSECNKKKNKKNPQHKPGPKITKCPKCGDNVLLHQINMHLDLKCDQFKKKWNKSIKTIDINDYKTNVPGLYLHKEFITEQEATDILKEINSNEWIRNRDNKLRRTRRIQHYGPPLDGMYRVVSDAQYFTKLPLLSKRMGQTISTFWNSCCNIPCGSLHNKLSMNDANKFNELLVNEYHADDELLFHFDQRGAFEELLCGISLVSNSKMSFQHKDNEYDIIKVKLPPRSVYFMTGNSRYKYKHGFVKNDIDGYRVSLTYRTVKSIFYAAKPPKKDKMTDMYSISTSKQSRLNENYFAKSNA